MFWDPTRSYSGAVMARLNSMLYLRMSSVRDTLWSYRLIAVSSNVWSENLRKQSSPLIRCEAEV